MIILALILWPFIFLFPYTLNLVGFGNDFQCLYYSYKVYLLDNLVHFHIPLWSPAEGAGFPFYANPFAQVLYPLNVPLAGFSYIFHGYTPYAHQLFTIFGLSIFSVGFYLWMRSLSFDRRASLFAALIITVSFKMTEILRFPNAVHTAAWYPWILWSVNSIFYETDLRKLLTHCALNMFFVLCLLTGGYPYYVYYSMFLFLPYLGVFFTPSLYNPVFGKPPLNIARRLGALAATCLAPLLLCVPYFMKMSTLLSQTRDRGGGNYEYSTVSVFGFKDTLGSLFYPPIAQSEGWYYFGCLGLFLIVIYFFSANRTEDGRFSYEKPAPKAFFLLWLALITSITYGRHSYLFDLLWRYLPGFKSLREWGRMNIILVPIIGWLLAVSYRNFAGILRLADVKRTMLAAAAAFTAVLSAQLFFVVKKYFNYYWLNYYVQIKLDHLPPSLHPFLTHCHLLFVLFNICSFLLLIWFLRAPRERRTSARLLAACLVVFSAADLWAVGPWMWMAAKKASKVPLPLNVCALDEAAFTTPRVDTHDTISLTSSFNAGLISNWYFERYAQFRSRSGGEMKDFDKLLGITDGQRLYFTQAIDHPSIGSFLADAARYPLKISKFSYTGDELAAEADLPRDGYLSFIDNWDPDWTASVDGKPCRIEILFGTFKSIKVHEGSHLIIFAYKPFGV